MREPALEGLPSDGLLPPATKESRNIIRVRVRVRVWADPQG